MWERVMKMKIEIRNDTAVVSGYVNAVGRDSRPITDVRGKFVEQIEPGAFRASLERSENVDLLLNHDKSKVYASTKDGSLKLTEDSIGLRAEAVLSDAEMIRKARSGEFRGWSFGMYVGDSAMEERAEGIPRRHVKSLNMFEVSLIDKSRIPCYVGTSVECRAEGEDVLAELRYSEEEPEIVEEERSEPEPVDYSAVDDVISELRYGAVDNVIAELRYNPYHDPSNGRFTSGGGGGGGAMIVVPKGEKAYMVQINKGYSDEEIDSMYQKYIEEQKSLDNSDKRPYNGVKVERDYKSSAAKFCGKEVYDKMCDDIERCDNKDIAELYASCINDVKFKSSSTKRDKAYYSSQTDTVVITKIGLERRRQNPQDFERTALHEIGHYIDFHNSENGNWYASQSSKTLLSALNNDSKAFVLKYCPSDSKLSKDAKGMHGLTAFNAKYGNNAAINGTVNISDMVFGSTGIKIYGGHDAKYFKTSGARETEALAEFMQSRIMNSKADFILRTEMPRSSASVEILAKTINGRRKAN